jgi:hypothetical protein
MNSLRKTLRALATIGLGVIAAAILSAQEPKSQIENAHTLVAQLYFYSIKDMPAFEEGYRRHLMWHAGKKDPLVWYAWTIDSGLRKGAFVDGTFGATFPGLDARPDPSGDGADFGRNVAPYVTALDAETWTLWPQTSTATPLEERLPGALLDVFLLQVDPAQEHSFEAKMEGLAKTKRNSAKLSWYRMVRGNNLPTYVLLLTRRNYADMESTGARLVEILANAYTVSPARVTEVVQSVRNVRVETWSYEPRLALIPGLALEP